MLAAVAADDSRKASCPTWGWLARKRDPVRPDHGALIGQHPPDVGLLHHVQDHRGATFDLDQQVEDIVGVLAARVPGQLGHRMALDLRLGWARGYEDPVPTCSAGHVLPVV